MEYTLFLCGRAQHQLFLYCLISIQIRCYQFVFQILKISCFFELFDFIVEFHSSQGLSDLKCFFQIHFYSENQVQLFQICLMFDCQDLLLDQQCFFQFWYHFKHFYFHLQQSYSNFQFDFKVSQVLIDFFIQCYFVLCCRLLCQIDFFSQCNHCIFIRLIFCLDPRREFFIFQVIVLRVPNILFWLAPCPFLSIFPKLRILLFCLAEIDLAYHRVHHLEILAFQVQLNNNLLNNQTCLNLVINLGFHHHRFLEFLEILGTHLQNKGRIPHHLYLTLPFIKRIFIFQYQFIAVSFLHFKVYA